MEYETGTVQIGSATLDPGTQRLKLDGREVRLHAKDMAVLLELVARAPEVVTREDLLARVWSRTVVGDNALDQVIARLRQALGDDARHPGCIETLPKRGYRLMTPALRSNVDTLNGRHRENGTGGAWALPSVTFVPLATVGSEPFLTEYAQIVSDDISNLLAESKTARVIAHELTRNGGWLATFLAQGNVRRVADQVRVSVQLVRTGAGDVLWSETFDEPWKNTRTGQFARAPFVARTIDAIVKCAHWADSLPTRNLEARRQFFYGVRECDSHGLGTGGDGIMAVDYFERAVELDPELKEPFHMLACAYANRLGGKMRAKEAILRAHQAAAALLRIDADDTFALGFVNHQLDWDYASAMANLECSRKHGGELSFVEYHEGLVSYQEGKFDDAIARIQSAIGMGLAAVKAPALCHLANLYYAVGRDALALVALDQARNCTGPIWLHGRLLRIPVAMRMGRLKEARADLEQTWCQHREREASLFPEAFAMLGRTEQAAGILRLNECSWRDGQLATAAPSFGGHYQLGDYDQAFLWLNRAIENREWEILPFLRSTLFYPNIRDDRRFDCVMRRVEEIEATGSPTKSVATQ